MHLPYTDGELVQLLRDIDRLGTVAAVARERGISPSVLRDWKAAAKARNLTSASAILSEVDKLKIALAKAKTDIITLRREADSADRIRTEIYRLAARSPEPPKWLEPTAKAHGAPGVPMTIWSDWHYGETVRPEEVGGVNEFSAEIAQARIAKLVDKTIEIASNHMGGADRRYPGIVVMLGGDMLSGDIHEELLATNDRTTQQCINELTDIIVAALLRLADIFGKVFVPAVVGNHGRSTRKPRMKGRVYTSHEWNIYCSIERHLRHDKRFSFLIPGETDAHFKVYGQRFLLTHGDALGVKGGDGIIGSLGPIMRGALKVGSSESQVNRAYDFIVMGHWHQAMWLPSGVIVNGSLKGYDEYARVELRAKYSPPSQQLWFVHPKHGITAMWGIQLDEKQVAVQEERGWVEIPWN